MSVKNRALITLFSLLITTSSFGLGQYQGYVQKGGNTVLTQFFNSTSKVQKSYPNATVTIYLTGTTTLATIYSDSSGTALGNPFSAGSDGSFTFFAADGAYDARFSGAGITTSCGGTNVAYPCISAFTLAGITIVTPNPSTVVSACTFSGINAGARINAAIASLPATGGIVDATCLSGAQTITTTIYDSAKPVNLKLGVGTYSVTVPSNGMAFNLLTAGSSLTGSGQGATIVQVTNEGNGVNLGSNTTVSNLTLRGNTNCASIYNCTGQATGINSGGASPTVRVEGVKILDTTIENFGQHAINLGGYAARFTVSRNTLNNNFSDGILAPDTTVNGICGLCGNGKITENIITNTGANAIDVTYNNNTISNNTLHHNGYGGWATGDDFGILLGGVATNNTVTGNSIAGNYGQAIILHPGPGGQVNSNSIVGNVITGACSTSLAITAVSNTNPVQITTSLNHGLITGNTAVVSGVRGNLVANTPYPTSTPDTITKISNTVFSIARNALAAGTYTSGGWVNLPGACGGFVQDGINIDGSAGGTSENNTIMGNSITGVQRVGILVDGTNPSLSQRNQIIGNSTIANTEYGIFVAAGGARDNTVALNVILGNVGGDLIQVSDVRTTTFGNKTSTTTADFGPGGNAVGGGNLLYGPSTFAALGTPADGTLVFCADCTNASNPCSGGSTGAFAKRLNGAWDCR
jgi:hypothetical protein